MMRDVILDELSACEEAKDVKVLLAIESGSRSWGFESKDSDYDVRFVYARPKDSYLTLRQVRDTIEWRLDDELDIVGWDISKYLRLLRKSNPTSFEWLGSGITYREEKCFQDVREVAKSCFDPVPHAHHYLGMAYKHDVRYLRAGKATLKRYLYAVRALLACRWAISVRKPIPMAFSELTEAMLEPELTNLVAELVEAKKNGLEKDAQEPIPELEEWIFATEDDLRAKVPLMKASERVPWPEIDAVFLKVVS